MGLFSGIAKAKPKGDYQFFTPGKFIVRLDKFKKDKTRKSRDFVAAEFTLLHVLDDNNGLNSLRVGDSLSWMIMADNDFFLGDVQKFVNAAVGIDIKELDDDEAEAKVGELVSDKQPLAGTFMEVHCNSVSLKPKDDKPAGKFDRVSFKGTVSAETVLGFMDVDKAKLIFPNGELAKKFEQEEAAKAKAAAVK